MTSVKNQTKSIARWKKRIRLLVLVVVCSLFALSPFLLYREDDTFQCAACFSKRQVCQWRVGSWPDFAIPVSPETIVLEESHVLRDLTAKPHVHNWKFFQGSPYIIFGLKWAGCALGSDRHKSEVAYMYESFADFRAFTDKSIKTGEISANEFRQFLFLPRFPDDDRGNDPSYLSVKEKSEQFLRNYWKD